MFDPAFRIPHSAISRCVFAVIAFVLLSAVVHACPTCKEGLDQADPQHQSVAAGYYYSILFMMSMPFAILGTFCSLAYITFRRARERQQLVVDHANDWPAD